MNEEKSHQLPSNLVAQELGEVNIQKVGDNVEVLFTILMEPTGKDAEGWRTGIALDASISMKWAYGKKLEGKIPDEVRAEYDKKGWTQAQTTDGMAVRYLKKEAKDDAIAKGYLEYSDNIMQSLGRDFIGYLGTNLDSQGKTNLVYWSCGDGAGYEVVGEVPVQDCKEMVFEGPVKIPFGKKTMLLPVLKYFDEYFRNARHTMAIFLTDGKLEDFDAVKNYTIDLAKRIENGARNPFKGVLIGVGKEVSRDQLEDLDDLETGTNVDIWDHKVAHEMRSLVEIFAEVVNEHQIIAPMGIIHDDQGNVVKKFSDGMPAMIKFEMPRSSKFFDLVVGEHQIRQTVEM